MKITKKMVLKLAAEGVDATTHHATIKKEFKALFDEPLDKAGVEVVRNLMNGTMTSEDKKEPADTPAPSQDDLMKVARSYAKGIGQKGSRVVEVTEATSSGSPARVIVKCLDPQKTGDGTVICDGTREVSIQDLFQVVRCVPCQKRSVQIYRNRLARGRRKELRERRAS